MLLGFRRFSDALTAKAESIHQILPRLKILPVLGAGHGSLLRWWFFALGRANSVLARPFVREGVEHRGHGREIVASGAASALE